MFLFFSPLLLVIWWLVELGTKLIFVFLVICLYSILYHYFYSLNQVGQQELVATKDSNSNAKKSTMESVLSLDDGSWLAEESGLLQGNMESNDFQLSNIRQPSPPPVLAQVMPEHRPISPSRVADPRPGPPKLSQDGLPSSNSYQDLHIVSVLSLCLTLYMLESNFSSFLVVLS